MDLSKTYNTRTRSRSTAIELTKKPEWYHRRPANCGADPSPASSYRTRASSSYAALASSQQPTAVRCRDLEPGAEPLGGYMNSTLAPRLDLYRDGVHGNLWHPGFYRAGEGGSPVPESSGGEESDSGSDVIFLVSSAKEPLLCSSFIQDGVRHMVEPLSPAVSSLDEGRSCYHLPQPLSSPSADSSYSEDSSDSSVDIPVHHARPVVLVSDLAAVYATPAVAHMSSEDDSDVVEVAVSEGGNPKRSCRKVENHSTTQEVRRSSRIRKPSSGTPPLCRGGTQHGRTRHSLRRRAKNDAVGIYNESGDSDDLMAFVVRASSSDESLPRPSRARRASLVSGYDALPPPLRTRSGASCGKSLHHMQDCIPEAKKPRRSEQKKTSRVAHSLQNSPAKKKPSTARRRAKRRRQNAASGPFGPREPEIILKFTKLKEERKKKAEDFCPFVRMDRRTCVVVNYQEDQADASRGSRPAGSLSGFIPNTSCFRLGRLGRLGPESRGPAPPLCCLCGYTANAMGLGDLHGPYCLTRAPNSERQLELPRRPVHSVEDGTGSPHGGEQEEESRRCSNSGLVNLSDEDGAEVHPYATVCPNICANSLCNGTGSPHNGARTLDGAGRPRDGTRTPDGTRSLHDGARSTDDAGSPCDGIRSLNGTGSPHDGIRSLDGTGSPHDGIRSLDGTGSPHDGIRSARLKAPLHLDECWIHEDCGIWSAGVFLVRGRLYGLEEAARLAQEAVCSSCQHTGAILGCFQKSCSRNYHFRCAIQSGCILNEENFSMRCPEHRNKPSTKQMQR